MPPKPPRKRRRWDPAPATDLLAKYLQVPEGSRRPEGSPRDMGEAWAIAAGVHAEGTVVLRRSRNGVVTIACADASVAQEVSGRSEVLAGELSAVAGVPVAGLRVVIADHAVPKDARPKPVGRAAGEAARAAAAGIAAQVEDEQVRAAVERAAAAALQRRWDG